MADDKLEARRDELTAYLDGELDRAAAADVERRLRDDPVLLHEAATLKRTWELLDFLPQPEPSSDFASRTVSVAVPIIKAAASNSHPARNPWPKRLVIAAAALAIFVVGYGVPGLFFKGPPKPLTIDEREEQMARDLRVIEHLPLYQYANDIDFLQGLDSPDLIGDD
jgi:anti-sigma factor RsiW